ncbi:MAG TPA: FG-GAP-like repeat-containing protein [Candidatus Acidoferrales bacterium]|nr:FG-GAP-like repeat-containing protein [Candidatus Acidoferrales bacterium]
MIRHTGGTWFALLAIGLALGASACAQDIFQPAQTYDSGGQESRAVAVGDLNHDGYPDIVVASECAVAGPCHTPGALPELSVLLNNGDGTFKLTQSYYPASGSTSLTLADINSDGNEDILLNVCEGTGCGSGAFVVLLGNGDGTFQQSLIPGADLPGITTMADVNHDGKLDIVIVSTQYVTSQVTVYLGNGDGTFRAGLKTDLGSFSTQSVAIKDLNGDGNPDLVIANPCAAPTVCSGSVRVALGNGDGTFGPVRTYFSGGYTPEYVVIADISGDGKPDIVIANSSLSSTDSRSSVGVLLGNGDGTFQSVQTYNSDAYGTSGVAVADVDGDSIPDIVTTNSCHIAPIGSNCGSGGAVTVLSGRGNGTFRTPTIYSTRGIQSNSLAVADLNVDGRTDVVAVSTCFSSSTCAYGGVAVLLNVWKFESTTALTSSLNPSTYGQSVTLTAKVTPTGPQPPTGSVIFRNGTMSLGSSMITDGLAILVKNKLPTGNLAITATYSGDSQSGKSISPVLTQIVNRAATHTAIKSSLNPSSEGQTVTFTATVTSATAKVTGTVTFIAGTTNLGTITLVGGKATVTTSMLTHGSTIVTVNFNGGTNFTESSASLTQVVN